MKRRGSKELWRLQKRAKYGEKENTSELDLTTIDTLPLEILGNHVFNFFCFDIWLRLFIFVSKRWQKACVQADVDKQIILDFSDDRHLLNIVNCLKKYRITTLILSLTKYAVHQLVEIVRASDRLRTLVYCNQFPYYDNELNSSISFRGITTLAIHIDHKKMLDAFPDVTRLEIRGDVDKHLVNLDKTYLKVKELLVTSQISHEIDSLKKKFPNLTHLALMVPEYLDYSSDLTHSLSQQWPISYSIISSREKNLSYKDFFSLNGSSKFFHFMSISNVEDALQHYFTHSSLEYECDLYSRAHEFSIGIDSYSSKSVNARSILPTNSCLGLPPMNRNFLEVLPALHWPYWINLTANAIYGSYEQALQILKQFNGERQFLEYGGPILLCELASKFQISQIIHYLGLDIIRALTKLRDRDGATFLHLMNFYKQKVNIQDLAEYIEDWNPRDNNGNTPLFRAFRARKLDHVQFLYCKGALLGSNGVKFEDILLTCNRDFNIMKPFLRTIRVDWDKLYVHSLFRIANFDILLEDSEGRSLLTQLCTRISEHNALIISKKFHVDINHIDSSGRTVLTAILESDASPNTLLERGANPNAFGTELGTSPLMLAVDTAARDEDRAKRSLLLLLAKKADINAVIEGANATQTALSYAVQRHFKAIVKLLIARGADVNFIDNQGNNLLHNLCKNLSPNGAALVPLLADKVQINHKNNLGLTPLQYAIQNNVSWALELVKYGAK